MEWNRWLCIILVVLYGAIGSNVLAQTNPFEIVDRLADIEVETVVNQDSTATISTDQPARTSSITQDKNATNPFEVSHIPLRKKDFIDKKKTKTTIVKKNFLESSYPLLALILCIILVAIILSQNRKLINELANSLLNMSSLNTLQRKYQNGWSIMSILLYIIFILNLALFTSKAFGVDTLRNFSYITICLSVIYLLKHTFVRATGYVFPIYDLIKKVNFSIISLHSFLGIILIPINLFLYFSYDILSSMFLYVGIGVIILNFLFRWLKGLFFGSSILSGQPFHFFIYLCSFEILPWIIGWKILSSGSYF